VDVLNVTANVNLVSDSIQPPFSKRDEHVWSQTQRGAVPQLCHAALTAQRTHTSHRNDAPLREPDSALEQA
jgi:hypothetical protein